MGNLKICSNGRAGLAGPATDFVCKMDCRKGPSAANGASNVPPPGIFDPPYTINNNLTQVNITVKVRSMAALWHKVADYKSCKSAAHCSVSTEYGGVQTISPAARYLDGELEYNRHNLYGLSTVIATRKILNNLIPKRSFILTRCAFYRKLCDVP